MSENRIRYKLNSANAQNNVNTDTFVKVNLEGSERLLPLNDINAIVDAGVVFNKERQNCTKYRILGTIKPIISNVLFNISGVDSWETFCLSKFTTDQYDNIDTGDIVLTYPESYNKYLQERDGWFGYYDPTIVYDPSTITNTTCIFNYLEPKPDKFSFIKLLGGIKNWELTVTYPFSADTKHYMVSGTTNFGLIVTDHVNVNVGGRNLIALSTPVYHGLKQGDRVRIKDSSPSVLDGDYRVIRLGLDNGDDKEFYFCIEIEQTNPNLNTGSFVSARMTRLVANQESVYYFRLFKKINTVNININNGVIEQDDYEIYPAAFSKTIYRDEVCQFVFNEDIDINGLVDNLGRPLSEMYLTVLKTKSNNMFTKLTTGVECGLVQNVFNLPIPMLQRLHNGTVPNPSFPSPIPLEDNITINDDIFYGDLVEYNKFEVIEHRLSVVGHRFNTVNRESLGNPMYAAGPRHEGYFYYPHTLLKIRDFSNYIEQGDINTEGIPTYAEDLGDGRWIWRDLLDIGLNDGQYETLNYPFLNGSHYLYNNFCFPVRRQDPYKQFDLYYNSTQPNDILGSGITNKFTVKSVEDAC